MNEKQASDLGRGGRICTGGLFVPKPGSQTSVVRILVSNLGPSVRQRPLVYVGVRGDRHSASHSACEPVRPAARGSPPGARGDLTGGRACGTTLRCRDLRW